MASVASLSRPCLIMRNVINVAGVGIRNETLSLDAKSTFLNSGPPLLYSRRFAIRHKRYALLIRHASQRVRIHIFIRMLQVNLVPVHPIYDLTSYIYSVLSYIVLGTWYEPVIPVKSEGFPGNYSTYHHQAPRTQHGFGREQR